MIAPRSSGFFRMPEVDPKPIIFPESPVVDEMERPYDEGLEQLLDVPKQFIQEKCYAWKTSSEFKFDLPPSAFDEKRNRPLIQFIRHDEVEEELEVRPLSDQQLATIKEDGTFIVPSRRYPVPYKWQLTQWLYKGKQRTYQSLLGDLGTSFSVLYYTKEFVVGDIYLSMRKRAFHSVYYLWRLLRLFVGIRSTFEREQVASQFLMEVGRHHRLFDTVWQNIQRELFEYLRLSDDMTEEQRKQQSERVVQLQNISSSFKNQWRAMVIKDAPVLLERFNNDELKEVLQKQYQEQYQRIVLSQLEVPRRIMDCIESLIEDLLVIQKYESEKDQSISKGCDAAAEQIRDKYTIRSKSETWFRETYEKASKLVRESYQENMIAELKRRVRSAAFPLYLEYLSGYDSHLAEIRERVVRNMPTRTFHLSFPLCPPYEVKYLESSQSYQLVTETTLDVDTCSELWRIKLYCVRYYTWLRNILYYAYRNMVVGKFGLFVLLRCHDFYPDYIINNATGEVGRDPSSKQTPIAAAVKDTILSVGRAREEFENAPDTGFFGKVCGRVFNVVYLYLIVSVFYMVGYLLVLKPALVLLNVVASLIVLVTAFLWTPLLLLFHYLWTILIYNYDYEDNYRNERERQFALRWFPLVLSTLKLAWDVSLLVLCFLLQFLSPITSLLLLLVFLLRYLLRRLYDQIMFVFIRCCGRSPVRETCAAWRISGPGAARNYFFNLREQDVYILVTAEIQKMQLEMLQTQITEELSRPHTIAQSLLAQVAKKFNLQPGYLAAIQATVQFYTRKLQEQLTERNRVLPDRPGGSIRFLEEELNLYVLNSKEILQGAVRKNPQFNYFRHLNVRHGDLEELVVGVWIRIFGSDSVFEPLEKLDQRLEIVEKREVDEVTKIMSTINKEVRLRTRDQLQGERFVYKSERAKRGERRQVNAQEYLRPVDIDQVLSLVQAHTYEQLPDSKASLRCSVISNANIDKIFAKYEKYLRGEASSIV